MVIALKRCSRCEADLPLTDFSRHPLGQMGCQPRCRGCHNATRRIDTSRARAIQEQRALRADGMKRCWDCGEPQPLNDFHLSNVSHDGYMSQCKVCLRATMSRRQKANREAANARHTRWRRANVEKVQATARNAQARRRAAFVEIVEPAVLLERDAGLCGFCREPVEPEHFDIDHIVPVSKGGVHSYANTRVAHPSCNRAAGGRLGAAVTNSKEALPA